MLPFLHHHRLIFSKQAAKRVLVKPIARKLPVTVDILLAIFKLLDFRHPLHVACGLFSLLCFSHYCVNQI